MTIGRCRVQSCLAVFAMGLFLAGTAQAGLIGPARPSDLVTKVGTVACSLPFTIGIDVTPNVPAGKVFVLTSFDWDTVQNYANIASRMILYSSGGDLAYGGGMADSDGRSAGSVPVPSGIAIRSGTTLCIITGTGFGSPGGAVHGYLTNDR